MIDTFQSVVTTMRNIDFLLFPSNVCFLKFGKYVQENKEKNVNKNIRCIPALLVISASYLLKSRKWRLSDNVKHFMPDMHCII